MTPKWQNQNKPEPLAGPYHKKQLCWLEVKNITFQISGEILGNAVE